MANYCNYEMHISGTKDKVQRLCDWLRAQYAYEVENVVCESSHPQNNEIFPTEHHIGFRNFEFSYDDAYIDSFDDDSTLTLYGEGYCAWSVETSMLSKKDGYLKDNIGLLNSNAISLVDACKALNLIVEVYSSEIGTGFSEHYYIDKGNMIIDDVKPYTEITRDDIEQYNNYTPECGFDKKTFDYLKKRLKSYGDYAVICEFYNKDADDWNWELL